MAIGTEFLIDYVNKRVYHDNGTTVYTVNALYTHLMDQFDEIAAMDDEVPMSAQTPTEYTMINGWFIDDESVKFLKTGAIKTIGYTGNVIQVLTNQSGGWTNCVAGDIGKVVTNGGSTHTGTLLAYNNTSRTIWVRQTLSVFTAEAWTITTGTGAGTATAVASGEDLYSNIYTLGTIADNPSPQVYVQQGESFEENVLTSWWPRGHIDVLIKVKNAGTILNDGDVRVFARQSGDLFDYFQIDLTAGGRNAVPLATSTDLNQVDADYYMFYDGISGITTTAASGTGSVATIEFAAQGTAPPVGSTVYISGVTPTGYNGAYTVTASSTTSVSYANTTTGAQSVAGNVYRHHSAGLIITDGTSGATAEVSGITAWGASGFLRLRTVIGTFGNNNAITDTSTGTTSALVNGAIGSAYIAYDAQGATEFTVGQVVTGTTSLKTGTITALQDDGASGKLLVSSPTGTFTDNELITDPVTGSATVNGDSTTAVSGYSNINVWFMNTTLNYDTGGAVFVEGETVTGITSGATGKVLSTGAQASGTLLIGNRNSAAYLDNEVLVSSTKAILFYASETQPFTVGKILTSASGAKGTITNIVDNGTTGILTLKGVTGTFLASELITDNNTPTAGSATTNGTAGTMYVAFNTETVAFTTLAQTLTGGSSGATGVIRAIQDNAGTDGYLLLNGGNGKLFQAETITGSTQGSATATGAQVIAGAAANGGGYPGSTITKAFDQSTAKNYKVVIDCGGQELLEVYEYLKFACRQGSTNQFFRTEDSVMGMAFRDSTTNADFTVASNDTGSATNDVVLMDPSPVAGIDGVGDTFYFGGIATVGTSNTPNKFGKIKVVVGTAGVGTWGFVWEYWNGSAWAALSNVLDATATVPGDSPAASFKVSGSKYVTYDVPSNWATTTVNGVLSYYVRARLSSYTSTTTAPLASYLQVYPPQLPVTGAVYSDAHFGYTPVKASPFGTFAGGKFFGARGIWLQNMASGDIQNYQLTDADNNTQTPPNYQSVTVANLLASDRVSVFRTTGTGSNVVNKAMYSASGSVNTSGNGTFVVDGAIAVDTPPAGFIRIRNALTGAEERQEYTSWSASTFTLVGTLAASYTTDDTIYVPYIDDSITSGTSKSVSVIYAADRDVVIRVRRYAPTAILPFETTGVFGSSGLSVSAIRTADTIVG